MTSSLARQGFMSPCRTKDYLLPTGACVYGDKSYNSNDDERSLLEETGVKLMPVRRKDMNPWQAKDRISLP